MKRLFLTTLTSVGLLCASMNPIFAQGDKIQADLDRGLQECQASNWDAAEKSFKRAYDAATAAGDRARLCQAAFQLGITETSLHKTAEAEKNFLTAIGIVKDVMPGNSPFAAVVKCLLADLYMMEDKYSQAEQLYVEGIPGLPPTPPLTAASAVQNLAVCYEKEEKFDLATKSYQKAMDAIATITGADSAESMNVQANYATFLLQTDALSDCEGVAKRVLDSKTATAVVRSVAANALSQCYDKQQRYGEAMKLARKSLTDYEGAHQTDKVREADLRLAMARIYKHGHKYRDAEKLIDQAVAAMAQAAPNNPDYADAIWEKGDLLKCLGQYDQAEPLFNQSLELRTKYLGPDHSDVARSLAALAYVYAQQNKYQQSEANYKRALEILKKSQGERSHSYLDCLSELGDLYKMMDRKADAESAYNTVLLARKDVLPADSHVTTDSVLKLASFYMDTQQPAKAEKLYSEAASRDAKLSKIGEALASSISSSAAASSGETAGLNPSTAAQASDLSNLAFAQEAVGNFVAAEKTRSKVKAIVGSTTVAVASAPNSGKGATPKASASDTGVADTPVGDKWALCIGISNFKDSAINLKYAAKDATDFRNFLVARGHFKPDHAKVLTDENASRQNIVDQLGDSFLAKNVKPNDLVVVYISSHGSQALDEAKKLNFLVAYDTNKNSLMATGIPMQWLSRIVQEQVHCKRAFVILDVCHSGSAADWSGDSATASADGSTSGGSAEGGKGLQRMLVSNPESLTAGTGQIILCSSSADQTSWESQQYPNGVFTRQLIDSLYSNGKNVTISGAYEPLKNKVATEVLRDRNQNQTPLMNGSWNGASLSPLTEIVK